MPRTPIPPTTLGQQINLLWIVIGAVLVIFMQAGFALVETGFCRAKHAAHVVSTNFAIFGLGFVGYFLVGYAFMFGGYSRAARLRLQRAPVRRCIGSGDWVFLWQGGFALSDMVGPGGAGAAALGFFLYMVAFMDTVATIPTGAMAERWKWKASSAGASSAAPSTTRSSAPGPGAAAGSPSSATRMGLGSGYVDFAGSGVVHAVGGVAALAGAIVLGPRIGKYNKDGSANTIPGHHIPMAMLGCFILLFGWFGFNAASTLAATDVQFAVVATNTAIAAAFGAVVGDVRDDAEDRQARPRDDGQRHARRPGRHHRAVRLRRSVGGGRHRLLAGVLVIFAAGFIEKRGSTTRSAPSPSTACAAPSACSPSASSPTAATAPAGTAPPRATWPIRKGVIGILGGDFTLGLGQLGAQALGVVVLWTVIFGIAFAFFKIQNAVMKGGIRPSAEMEIAGMDLPEMGALAYPEFEFAIERSDPEIGERPHVGSTGGTVHEEEPVTARSTDPSDAH